MRGKVLEIIAVIILFLIAICCLTGCTGNSADTVRYNLSKEADEFNVRRIITFINLRSDEFLFTITGNCSIKGGYSDSNKELEVICQVGKNKYQKHMLYLTTETTYVIEQLEYNEVSRYDYEIIFRPKAIVPITIKTETEGY